VSHNMTMLRLLRTMAKDIIDSVDEIEANGRHEPPSHVVIVASLRIGKMAKDIERLCDSLATTNQIEFKIGSRQK